MASLNSLVHRLSALDKELSPEDHKDGSEEDANLDEFGRTKKRCARTVADIRKQISERDELLEKQAGGGTKQTVEMSARIRQQLRSLRDDAQKLSDMQRDQSKKAEKKKKGGPSQDEVDHRAEVVDLVWKHIEECESLEKRRLGGPASSNARSSLLSGNRASHAIKKNAQETELKDIDDPELAAGLQQLKERDQALDRDLDEVSKGVNVLKGIALDMREEVKMQNVMVDELNDKVDQATDHLRDLNQKLKDTLEKVGGAQKIIVNAILIILILAVAAFAYKIVKDGK